MDSIRVDDDLRVLIQRRYIMAFDAFLIKDHITHYHSLRVAEVAMRFCNYIGEYFGFPADLLQQMFYLHDFGKIGIQNKTLKSKKRFSEGSEERVYYIEPHPQTGFELLKGLPRVATNIARYHHEKWDGTGYLRGISGKRIPLEARIVALIDAFDAIVAKRNYKESESLSRGLKIIRKDSGSHFDPELVDSFDFFLHNVSEEVDEVFVKLYPLSLLNKNSKGEINNAG